MNKEPPYTYADITKETGIPGGTLRVWLHRGKLPTPDMRVGQSPAWLPATIKEWVTSGELAKLAPPNHEGVKDATPHRSNGSQ